MSGSIREAIQAIVKDLVKVSSIRVKVKSVDKTNDTCVVEPLRSGAIYEDVKLKAVVDKTDNRFIVYPKVDSIVHISIVDNNDSDVYVSQVTEFESFLIQLGADFKLEIKEDQTMEISTKGFKFDGGANGGLIIQARLAAELAKNNAMLNGLKNGFTNWIPVPNDGGAALKATMLPILAPLNPGDFSNITNDNVKH